MKGALRLPRGSWDESTFGARRRLHPVSGSGTSQCPSINTYNIITIITSNVFTQSIRSISQRRLLPPPSQPAVSVHICLWPLWVSGVVSIGRS